MEDAELYQKHNSVQREDATESLEKWKKIQLGSNALIMDVGCGDGSVTTTILKQYLPSDFKKLIGCDINEKVVKFANERYMDDRTEFMQLNIEGDLPEELKGVFDYVFSNYVLHWVRNLEKAYQNIYTLLKEGGHCLLVILGSHVVFDAFRIMFQREKWKSHIQDVERIISPYHDSRNPEHEIKNMLTEIGFKDIDVKCDKKICIYDKARYFMNFLKSANFYRIPSGIYEDYLNDLLQLFREMKLLDENVESDDAPAKFNYHLLVVYASK